MPGIGIRGHSYDLMVFDLEKHVAREEVMDIQLTLYEDAQAFLQVVGVMLYARETINNLILGISERLVEDPGAYKNPFFATLTGDDGEVKLAAVMTPPHNIVLAGGENFELGIPLLISYLQGNKISVPGVIGPVQIAECFVEVWKRMVKQSNQINMRQRVYELRAVHMPPMPPGHFRVAEARDVPKITEWFQVFEEEALGEISSQDLEKTKNLVSAGDVFVWEQDGEIVSMAMKTLPIANSITISGVYTPPEHRRQGYATALVARLSQHLLDLGYQFVNLFTDLNNPTSNGIYMKIGYHPVCDFRMYKFNEENIEHS